MISWNLNIDLVWEILMKNVAIVGWRGMVGSVLMKRMQEEGDFKKIKATLFSTSQKGQKNTFYPECNDIIADSNDINELSHFDIIITCQGGDYSKDIYPKLKDHGWKGYWIDAASSFRMDDDATIILDPLNMHVIEQDLDKGIKKFIGGNCTVSLMLMGLGGLFQEDLVESMVTHTYQAASGAGAQAMMELLNQSHTITSQVDLNNKDALMVEKQVTDLLNSKELDTSKFISPLSFSLIPWIDSKMENGQSREEWKAMAEANKILGMKNSIAIDGTCVRVPSLRCHSQAFMLKLKQSVDLKTVEELIAGHNEWVEFIPNDKEATLQKLTPAYVSGTHKIPVGRVRKSNLGDQYINAFSIGDQLLWGAAEPLRRMLNILLDKTL
jgi:aspartate-semialdehyde dehydrogenase